MHVQWVRSALACAVVLCACAEGYVPPYALRNKRPFRLQSSCSTDLDCDYNECCIPAPDDASHRTCSALGRRREICHPGTVSEVPWPHPRQFGLCPCRLGLSCSPGSWTCDLTDVNAILEEQELGYKIPSNGTWTWLQQVAAAARPPSSISDNRKYFLHAVGRHPWEGKRHAGGGRRAKKLVSRVSSLSALLSSLYA